MIGKPKFSEKSLNFVDKKKIINKEIILEGFEFNEVEDYGKAINVYFHFPESPDMHQLFSTFSTSLISQFENINVEDCKGDRVILRISDNNQYYLEPVKD